MKLEIPVIYEDADVLAINKPAGIRVHEDGRGVGETVVDWLLINRPEIKNVGEATRLPNGKVIDRPGIVHRLDKDTSGVMIIAKTPEAFAYLKDHFKQRQVNKLYWAILQGPMSFEGERFIDLPIGRSSSDARVRVASAKAKGKLRPAKTRYKILGGNRDFTWVAARPETGRTHQLRAHFKAVQHPIVGDKLYNKEKDKDLGMLRQALHAYSLSLDLPSGAHQTFVAPVPKDFQAALDNLRSAC